MSTLFGDDVRGQIQDGNEGIINKPGMEQTYAGTPVSALKDNSKIPVDERQGLFELGSTLSKPFGKLLDNISKDNQDQRAIEAAGRQGMSTAMNQINQDKKRFGLAEAWGGQSIEYRTAQMIAVENTFEKMHLDDLDSIDQYAELTPQQFLDHRAKLLQEYTAPWKDDKEALLKITDKFINNTRSLVNIQAKEHKALTMKLRDDNAAERLHIGYAVQAKEVEAAKGNPEKLKEVHGNIVKLMTFDPEIHGKEGFTEDEFNGLVMKSTVSELEVGNPGPMRGLMQLIKQNPKMMDSKSGKVAMSAVRTAKNAWYADTAAGIKQRVKELEQEGEENPLKALRDLENNSIQLYAENRNLWDTDGEKLVEQAKLAKGELRGKDVQEHFKNLKLGNKIKGLENRAGRIDLKNVQGLSKKGVEQYGGLISKAAADYGVDEAFIHAIIQNESSYNKDAKSTFVPKEGKFKGQTQHAYGLMQLYRPERKGFTGGSEEENVTEGTKQLADELKFFKGDMRLAAASYNAGRAAVQKYNDVPPYPETQKYVKNVMSTYDSVKNSTAQTEDLSPEEFRLLTKNEQLQAESIYAQRKLDESKQNAVVAKEHDSGLIRAMEEVRSAYVTLQAANTLTDEDVAGFEKEISMMEPWSIDGLHRKTTELGKLLTLKTRLQKGALAQKADVNTHNSIEMRRAQEVNKEHVGPSIEGNLTAKEMDLQNDFTAAMAVNRIEAEGDGRKLQYAWLSPGKTVDIAGTVGKLVADPKLAMKYAQKLDKIGIPPGGKNEVAKTYAIGAIASLRGEIDENGKLSEHGTQTWRVIAEMLHEKESAHSIFSGKEFAQLSYIAKEILSGGKPEEVLKDWGKISTSVQTKSDLEKGTTAEVKGDKSDRQKLLDAFHVGLGGDPDTFFGNAYAENPEEFAGFVENYNLNKAAGYDDKTAKEHAKKTLRSGQAVVNGHVVYGSYGINRLPVMDGKNIVAGYNLEDVLNNSSLMKQEWARIAGSAQDSHIRDLKDMKIKGMGYDVITEELLVDFAGVPYVINKSDLLSMAKAYHNEVLGKKALKEHINNGRVGTSGYGLESMYTGKKVTK